MPEPIDVEAVSTIRMTCGGEKKHQRIICDGMVQQWIGFGWVAEREATAADRRKLPAVRGREFAPAANRRRKKNLLRDVTFPLRLS